MSLIKTSYTAPKDILAVTDNYVCFPVQVTNTGLTAGSDGKKVLAAGTPITGDLCARGTAFAKATTSGSTGSTSSNAVAILLNEVDVTGGATNGVALVFGFVDVNKLDSTTAALITTEVKTALKGSVYFVK